ncbi:MAG: hypothetical protein F9K23_18515 [Bacteroidetes bacterium]|nr:MAG: hypothetical protein F9K23_18515 [Bacteroidota bacterium]
MNDKVIITPLTLYAQHERGKTMLFDNQRTGEFILGYRVKDSISGRHYHTGAAGYKNPEVLILISGSIQLKTIDLDTKNEQVVMIEEPSCIEIFAMVWHEVLALTDCVFLEMNSIADCEADTHKLEQTV